MKEKTFQRNKKKWGVSVNSYYLKNHIYLTDIIITLILNVAAEVLCIFLDIGEKKKKKKQKKKPPWCSG